MVDRIENEDIVELGLASVETQGHGVITADLPAGQPSPGILDD